MKKLLAMVLTLCLCVAAWCGALAEAAPEGGAAYTERETKVFVEGEEAGTLPLRFYADAPHVPCMGIGAYSNFMYRRPLTLVDNGDGTCALENEIGEALRCDPEAGVILAEDWNRFFDLPMPLEDEAMGWKDTRTRFARIVSVEYEGEAEPVELDFARYGIPLHADGEDIYLPVSTLSNMMTDIATNHLLYNGESLYAQRIDLNGLAPAGLYNSQTLDAELQGQPRPEDVVRQCYADLCFNFDHFFGHPGKAPLDAAIAEVGLDRALEDLGAEGQAIKAALNSPNLNEYLSAMSAVFSPYLNDGHTVFTSGASLITARPEVAGNMGAEVFRNMLSDPATMRQIANMFIPAQRRDAWGEETYIEAGSTAILRLDSFMPDEAAWDRFYNDGGEFPQDGLGNVITGLRRASENPAIQNVILDLSCNGGGSPDVMMAILAVTTGQNQLYGYNRITGRNMTITFEADANVDGVYDERDRETRYDFNYGVLTTRFAFSCGNLCPIIMQEGGAVLIGEPTSGGACCVQVGSDAERFTYMMSSAQWLLVDSEGNSVEGGCKVDLPIEPETNETVNALAGLLNIDGGLPSFKGYFDGATLDGLMNDWYQSQPAAA